MKLIEEDVALKQRMCAEDLEKAEPALVAAQAALDTLNKVNLFHPENNNNNQYLFHVALFISTLLRFVKRKTRK